jgi:hypothetical protein
MGLSGRRAPGREFPDGVTRFAVPRHALRFYFPALWPEAEQDEAFLSGAVGLPPLKASRRP